MAKAKEVLLPMTSDSSQPLDSTAILMEALDLPLKTGKPMFSITLLLLFPFSLFVLLILPLMQEFQNLELHDCFFRIQKNLEFLVGIEEFFWIIFYIVTLFKIKQILQLVNLKDLLMRFRSLTTISMKTWVYFSLVTVAYMLLVAVSVVAFVEVTNRGNYFDLWTGLVGVLAAVFYLILVRAWLLGLVNSVLEEDCYGFKKKFEGHVLVSFLLLLSGPISVLVYLISSENDLGISSRFALGCLVSVYFFVEKLVVFVVYYKMLNIHKERIIVEELGNGEWV